MDDQVKQYFLKQPPAQRKILEKIRRVIRQSVPQATERMSYGVPAFHLNGNLIMYAGFAKHIGVYPHPDTLIHFADDLRRFETTKGTIRFKLDEPIPYDLIERIVQYRVRICSKFFVERRRS